MDASLNPNFTLGITGSMGCGKSTLTRILKGKYDVCVVDADDLAKNLMQQVYIWQMIEDAFGSTVMAEHGVNHRELARVVFNDDAAYRKLKAILVDRIVEFIREYKACSDSIGRSRVLVLDVPLLFETGLDEICDFTCVVCAGEATRFGRLKNRGFREEDVVRRLKYQMPQRDKIERATYTIWNSGDIARLEKSAETMMNHLELLWAFPPNGYPHLP